MVPYQGTDQVDFIGESTRARQLRSLIHKVGAGHWPVLIVGETGTGKELVARNIYAEHPVGPFVTIDCSALVGTIMESELFGHAKGAYTGAFSAKKGLIEAADGGTAFFDEIGELPLEVQSKLLRLLQEKEFRPVGSLQWRRSDFRVISATNRDLAKEVERGTFRRDLYYRLNVVQIKVQPLRERRTDIPLLVDHFLHIYGRGHHVSEEVMNAFLSYDWPGNVRELENTIQHMVAIGDGPIFTIVDVPDEILHFMKARQTTTSVEARDSVDGSTIGSSASSAPAPPFTPAKTERVPMMTLSDLEKIAISQALEYTRGDTSVAASLLGIGRATLYRKIKEYGLAS